MDGQNLPEHQKDWQTELHENDVFLLFRGQQAGILFLEPGIGMDVIRKAVATLNAYYPTEPARRVPTQIRINKVTDPGVWYARLVGQVLTVERIEVNRRPDQGLPESVYWCREGGAYNAINYVRMSDATEV